MCASVSAVRLSYCDQGAVQLGSNLSPSRFYRLAAGNQQHYCHKPHPIAVLWTAPLPCFVPYLNQRAALCIHFALAASLPSSQPAFAIAGTFRVPCIQTAWPCLRVSGFCVPQSASTIPADDCVNVLAWWDGAKDPVAVSLPLGAAGWETPILDLADALEVATGMPTGHVQFFKHAGLPVSDSKPVGYYLGCCGCDGAPTDFLSASILPLQPPAPSPRPAMPNGALGN